MDKSLLRIDALARELNSHGFDICHSFHPKWYNDVVLEEGIDLMPLPNDDTVLGAVLIGNTRHLWRFFINWINKEEAENVELDHPLDVYCKEIIGAIAQKHAQQHDVLKHCDTFWSSTYSEKLVSMQRVAMVSGFAYFDTNTQLIVHPTYGTWTAYRAVVIFRTMPTGADSAGVLVVPPRPTPMPCLLTPAEQEEAKIAMQRALDISDMSRLCDQLQSRDTDLEKEVWSRWIAMRDSVHTGKDEYRFGTQQLMYHYTKDPVYLKFEETCVSEV